jgi:cyanophycin synthetase
VPFDGRITVLRGSEARPLIDLLDVPLTIAGISSHNVMNAMQAASAALGVGLPERAVTRGLRTFVTDAQRNPGRGNLFELDGRVLVIDYAHNAAGMAGLTEICRGLRRPGRQVWLAICTAGDRTDQILHDFAYTAARGADRVAIAELAQYLRGRERQDIIDRLMAGARDGGAAELDVYADELSALRGMVGRSKRGDVVAVTALGMRPEIFAWLAEVGAETMAPSRVRRVVAGSRKGPAAPRRAS